MVIRDHLFQINPWMLALTIGLLPLLIVTGCTTYSMHFGLTARCNPLTDGCLSISAACRSVPVIYFFRAGMLPCSALLVVFWLLNAEHLAQQVDVSSQLKKLVLVSGVTGSLFLILYVLFLGTNGDVYRFLRRFGVYVFFGGTALAQLLTVIIRRHRDKGIPAILQRLMVTVMLLLGPFNLAQKGIFENADSIENVIEWHFGLLFCLFFIVSAIIWRNESARTQPGG